jgi:hypothetical protein
MRTAKKVHKPGDTRVGLYMCPVAHALWLVILLSIPLLVGTVANGGKARRGHLCYH